MSNDFEVEREPDGFDSERPDPEEPATWQREGPRETEADELDWADQHSAVEPPLPEEEAPASDVETNSGEREGPD